MMLEMLKGKIHRARLTECEVDYEGSLEIDIDYLNEAGILPYEKILVVNAITRSKSSSNNALNISGFRRFIASESVDFATASMPR